MHIGDFVIWRGRTYRLLGFDPMSVVDRRAHLEDPETGRRILVQADELETLTACPTPCPPAG